MPTPTYCRKKASEIGPHTSALIEEILREHAMKNLRKAQALLRLAEKYWRYIHGGSSRASPLLWQLPLPEHQNHSGERLFSLNEPIPSFPDLSFLWGSGS